MRIERAREQGASHRSGAVGCSRIRECHEPTRPVLLVLAVLVDQGTRQGRRIATGQTRRGSEW